MNKVFLIVINIIEFISINKSENILKYHKSSENILCIYKNG